jgi:transposase
VLLNLNKGLTVRETADAYFLSTKTVYRYLDMYREGGLEALLTYKKPSGRLSKMPDNIAQIIADALVRSPSAIECLDTKCQNWTLELMQRYLELRLCNSYVGRLLQWHGFKRIYSCRVMTSPDPQYKEKRDVVDTLKKKWEKVHSKKVIGSSHATK